MRFYRFAITFTMLTGLTFFAYAQPEPATFSGLTFVLPEPAFPEPGLPEPGLPEPGLPEPPSADATRDGDATLAASTTQEPVTTSFSPEGLPLPGIHLPDASDQPPRRLRSAALLNGRAAASVWLDPGTIAATGTRRPTQEGADPADADALAENDAATGATRVAVLPARVIVMPPEGWMPQWPIVARDSGGVVAERQVIAYYGHPNSTRMGILGELPIEEMAADLLARAAEYDAINGPIGVAPAFHIIYGTVWEDANIGILRETKLLEYIEFAQENGIIVFLDHQIGRFTVAEAINSMLPYLAYPHVHLAIDPEWATTAPGQVIGQIDAEDLNRAQRLISDYLILNGIAGPKMLVVHQFNWRMISNRELVRTDFPNVQLIHNADGFGPPAMKIVSWESNVQAANMPLKGFKLFYPKSWRDGGYDDPLLSPIEVMQLEPVPVYIQYQ